MKLFVFALLAFVAPQSLWAWSDLGHQTTAEVADRFLTPKGKALVREILGNGPLAEASTFADFVKSDTAYAEFAGYHFVEIDPRWQTYDQIPEYLRAQRDADTILHVVPEKLFSLEAQAPRFTANQRRDLFKFLVHVVGDVHHPLHVGNSFDRGGTWCDIKYPGADGKSHMQNTNLHAMWDSNLVNFIFNAQAMKDPSYKLPKYQGFTELADLILKDADIVAMKADYEKIAAEPILEWYRQSQALHPKVYPDAQTADHPKARTYCKHLDRDEKGMELKDEKGVTIITPASSTAEVDMAYMRNSAEVIKVQILKGGLRLADVINKMADKQYPNAVSLDQKTQDIKKMLEQLVNFNK